VTSGATSAWKLLRRRPILLLWLGGTVSRVGDWVLLVALPVHVFALTGSSAATATAFLFELVPRLLLGSLAGTVVDRFDRRRIVVGCSVAQAVLMLPIALVDSADRLWILYLCAAVLGVLANVCASASQALLGDVVRDGEIAGAVALTSLGDNLARLAGAPLGGALVGFWGIDAVVALDVASFLVVGACTAAVVIARPASDGAAAMDPPEGTLRAWMTGLRELGGDADLRVACAVHAVGSLAQGMFLVLFVVWVGRALGGGGEEIGVLRGVQAAGGVFGAAVVAGLAHRVRPGRLMGLGATAFGVISLALWNGPAVTTAPIVYVIGFIVVGLPGAGYMAGALTFVQVHASPAARGRILSTVAAIEDGMQALGVLGAGLLAERVAIVPAFSVQAGVWIAAGLLSLALLDRTGRSARRARQTDAARGDAVSRLVACPSTS
jgi:predicted MFS family arabinose efflux permease